MVNGVTTGKDNARVRGYVDLLLSKILGRNALEFNERAKVEFKIKLFRQLEIRRLVALGPGLRDQNVSDAALRRGAFTPFTTHILTGNWVQK
jgi:hypothetical protein